MPDQRDDKGETKQTNGEARCPKCGYFICERIFGQGESGLKFVCKRCKVRLLVRISAESVTVGQI